MNLRLPTSRFLLGCPLGAVVAPCAHFMNGMTKLTHHNLFYKTPDRCRAFQDRHLVKESLCRSYTVLCAWR